MAAPAREFVSNPPPATRTRFVVALWLCGLAAVLYLDRICMSQAVKPIQDELGLTKSQMSYVLMAFTLAYGLFEIPSGRLGDRFGSRNVLTRIVLWWSVFTALTGTATGLVTLVVMRFLFGAGEAGAFPNAARVIARWFPHHERGRVQGIMLGSAQLGAVAAPTVAAQLIEVIGWRWAFAVFGALGVVWAFGFWWWFRDDPAKHTAVSKEELAIIRADAVPVDIDPGTIPWRAILTNRGIIVLSCIMVFGAFYTYFFYSWLSNYLMEAREVPNTRAGWLTSGVMVGSALGTLFGGWVADRIPHWLGDAILARRLLAVGCYLMSAACLLAAVRSDDATAFAALCGASMCLMHITLPNWWSLAIPQGGRHIGTVFGLMNGLGVLGAMSSQWFVGAFADWRKGLGYVGREQWDPMFGVYVGVLVLNAVAWWLYRFRPLDDRGSS